MDSNIYPASEDILFHMINFSFNEWVQRDYGYGMVYLYAFVLIVIFIVKQEFRVKHIFAFLQCWTHFCNAKHIFAMPNTFLQCQTRVFIIYKRNSCSEKQVIVRIIFYTEISHKNKTQQFF